MKPLYRLTIVFACFFLLSSTCHDPHSGTICYITNQSSHTLIVQKDDNGIKKYDSLLTGGTAVAWQRGGMGERIITPIVDNKVLVDAKRISFDTIICKKDLTDPANWEQVTINAYNYEYWFRVNDADF